MNGTITAAQAILEVSKLIVNGETRESDLPLSPGASPNNVWTGEVSSRTHRLDYTVVVTAIRRQT